MQRAILFDFNGVIINDEPQHCQALIATLADYDIALNEADYYRDYLGFDDRECFRFSFARRGLPATAPVIAGAIEQKARHYAALIRDSMHLVPGSAEFIRAAAEQGYRLAIVSGALRREIDLVLSEAGLRPLFSSVVAAEDVSACKPDPQGYARARSALAIAPDRCMVIEDSLPGLAAARAAGLRCAMVATSHSEAELASADLVWSDLLGHTPAELPWVA